MFLIFFIIFVATPIIEIALFIEIGGLIGVAPTILIVIVTAIVGSVLLRLQGGAVIQRTQQALRAGELPVDPVIDGISLMMAGALLLTPGFFTDTVGFLLFVPPFRRWLARRIFAHMVRSGNVLVMGDGPEYPGAPPGGRDGRGNKRHHAPDDDTVIDVEYEPVEDEPRDEDRSRRHDESGEDAEPRRRRSSPWRK